MSSPQIVALAVWLLSGVGVALYMHQRGHSWRWLLLATTGPFLAVLALAEGSREREASVEPQRPGDPEPGRRAGAHILAGVDGSSDAEAALLGALALVAGVPTVTLAAVVDYEAARYPEGFDQVERARALLEKANQRLVERYRIAATTVVLAGEPARALLDHARVSGDHLVVVGRRGAGRSLPLLGRVATRLAQHADVPVLIGGSLIADSPSATSSTVASIPCAVSVDSTTASTDPDESIAAEPGPEPAA